MNSELLDNPIKNIENAKVEFVYRSKDEMKDSDVEWIGLIPKDWIITRLKYLAKICNGKEQSLVLDENGIYPILGTGGVFGRATRFLYDKPSVLLGRKGTIDKPQYIEEPFWTVDTLFYTQIYKNVSTRLFFYLCKTINFNLYSTQTALPSMTQEDLNTVPFAIMKNKQEQEKISSFLDKKTAEFDTIIEKKEKIINKLEEAKKSLISEAVTGKIKVLSDSEFVYRSPDEMKDSGVEWIGDIPKDWSLKKLKYLANIVNDKLAFNNKYRYIGLENIESWTGKIIGENKEEQIVESICSKFSSGNVLFNKLRPYLAKCIIPNFDGYCTSELIVLDTKNILNKYLQFLMLTSNFINTVNASTFGVKMPRANWDFISNLEIPIFSIQEQEKIASFLDKKTSEFDTIIEKEKRMIEKIKEAKQSLISEAVTGKIKVL